MNKYLLLFLLTACVEEQAAPIKPRPLDIAGSDCVRHNWKDRGKAPLAFIEGMVNVYKLNCKTPVRPIGPVLKDALALYGLTPTQANVYALLLGLGMRESSGKYCEGRDASAGNTASDTCEAGAWQTSYNSRLADAELPKIIAKYQAHPELCLLDIFNKGISCSAQNLKIYGTGHGADFQKLSKSCPAFALEYASIGIRVVKDHWGPLRRREAEVVPACVKMFETICK